MAFDDETASPNSRLSGARPSRQVPDEELDEVFADKRVSDIGAEYDEDGDDDGEPHEAGGMTLSLIHICLPAHRHTGKGLVERQRADAVSMGQTPGKAVERVAKERHKLPRQRQMLPRNSKETQPWRKSFSFAGGMVGMPALMLACRHTGMEDVYKRQAEVNALAVRSLSGRQIAEEHRRFF